MDSDVKSGAYVMSLDDRLREAVGKVLSADAKGGDISKVQELLDIKAAALSAPFLAEVRRIKESA